MKPLVPLLAGFFVVCFCSCSPWTAEDRIALGKLEAKANEGDPQALYNLGACYLNGLATYTNVPLAADCWRKAAEKGYAPAQLQYAHCFWRGSGVPQNISNAVHWFGQAALQGESEAQHNYGFAYLNGLGVPKDRSAAIMWFTKAASQGNAGSAFELAQLYIKDETGDPAIEAQGVQWLRKAADMGYPAAQYNMGRVYTGGLWFDTDLAEAYKWYLLASDAEPERCREPLAALQLSLSPDDLAKAKSLAAEFRLRRDVKIKHPLPN